MASQTPRKHGGVDLDELARLGIDPNEVVDASANINPYGPCRAVVEAARSAPLDYYPDSTALAARRALSESPERLALGNGAAELLWTVARVVLCPGDTALVVEPTFAEFSAAARQLGARVVSWSARAEQQFALDLPAIAAAARRAGATAMYLCTPNTPTGAGAPAIDIAEMCAALPDIAVVVDQSFLALSDRHADASVIFPDNAVIVRSLTKEYAIPGVRVGYAIAHPRWIARIESARPAWTTSAPAQAAAIAAAGNQSFVADTRARVLSDRDQLAGSLAALGIAPVPSEAPFVVARVGDAAGLRLRMLIRHRVLVRDCTSFGLRDFIRIAARPAADRQRIADALKAQL